MSPSSKPEHRPADDEQRKRTAPDAVQEASEESFPASDSPSFTPISSLGPPPHCKGPSPQTRPVKEVSPADRS